MKHARDHKIGDDALRFWTGLQLTASLCCCAAEEKVSEYSFKKPRGFSTLRGCPHTPLYGAVLKKATRISRWMDAEATTFY